MYNVEEKVYHLGRIMFYIDEDKEEVIYAPRTSCSHKEWLVNSKIMSEEKFNKVVRGIAYANEIIIYQGDFEYNEHVELLIRRYYTKIIKHLELSRHTLVYGGVLKGKIGKRWKGYKLVINGML